MEDAARNSGLLAVIAEVGAGKTVMRREVIEKLRSDEKVRIVYPQIIDRNRVTAGSLCDEIVWDLSSDKVKQTLAAKSRHVRKLLSDRLAQGVQVCLIVEEAHRLTVPALKHLKVFHEIEEGRKKLLSIILLGQPELGQLLDEEQYPELRELSRRVQIASIPGLGDNVKDYLALKFKIVGGDIDQVITDDAIKRLCNRLTAQDGSGRAYSTAYPLSINNYMAKAMILAQEMGEERVTADVIEAL
jgi:type II secretory pathway predicted ATPase ExeA